MGVFLGHRQCRLDGGLDRERAADAGDFVVDLGTVDQSDRFRFLVVGDGFERDTRHQAADFLALAVLFALIKKSTRRALRRGFEGIPREGRGEQPLPCQRQWHAGGIAGNPAAAPLLGDVGRRAGTADNVHDQIAGVGGHQKAALDC